MNDKDETSGSGKEGGNKDTDAVEESHTPDVEESATKEESVRRQADQGQASIDSDCLSGRIFILDYSTKQVVKTVEWPSKHGQAPSEPEESKGRPVVLSIETEDAKK